MPIKEIFRELPEMFNFNNFYISAESEQYNYDLNELAIAKTNELLKERISDIVYEKTGIKPDDVYIYINQEDYKNIAVEKIIIDIPENKSEEVRLYLKQLFNCDVDLEVKENE